MGLQKCSRGSSLFLLCCAAQEDSFVSEGCDVISSNCCEHIFSFETVSFVSDSNSWSNGDLFLPGFGVSPQPRCHGNVGIIREPHTWIFFATDQSHSGLEHLDDFSIFLPIVWQVVNSKL